MSYVLNATRDVCALIDYLALVAVARCPHRRHEVLMNPRDVNLKACTRLTTPTAMSDDTDEKGFMDKVKEKAGEIQTAMGPAMESAQKRMSEWGSKVQEKYEEFKADMAPKVARGRKSVVAMTESVKVNVIDPTAEWGSKVKAEWQEPYDGKVALAGCCCISLLDLTYPTCIGLRFKGYASASTASAPSA